MKGLSMDKRFRGLTIGFVWFYWTLFDGTAKGIHLLSESIGQCTGKHDKHGVLIYEGDICCGLSNVCSVAYNDDLGFVWKPSPYLKDEELLGLITQSDCDFVEIIGNIHQF